MKHRFFFAKTAALLAALAGATSASAEPDRPVVIAYDAPPECGTLEAFRELLSAEIARSPNPTRPWRFSVRIRREADAYEGTLTTESGTRTLTAARCDDVTSAFAVIVAVADADLVSPLPLSPAPVTAPPSGPALPPAPERAPRPAPLAEAREAPARIEWRFAARPFLWSHGPAADFGGAILGGLGVVGVELPWGLSKMMFELGIGYAWASSDSEESSSLPGFAPIAVGISYTTVETQACLVDLPIERTGLSALGCLRVAAASYKSTWQTGGALWGGPGLRLRWQSPVSLFLEAGVALVAGSVTSGAANAPFWAEGATSLGFML